MKVSMYILITGNNLITEPNEYVCNPSLSQIKVFFWRLSVVLALVDHKMSVSIFKVFDKYIGGKPHKYCDIYISCMHLRLQYNDLWLYVSKIKRSLIFLAGK